MLVAESRLAYIIARIERIINKNLGVEDLVELMKQLEVGLLTVCSRSIMGYVFRRELGYPGTEQAMANFLTSSSA